MASDTILYLFLMVKKKTFGELKKREKQKISHRYEAFKKIKKYFKFS